MGFVASILSLGNGKSKLGCDLRSPVAWKLVVRDRGSSEDGERGVDTEADDALDCTGDTAGLSRSPELGEALQDVD